MVKVSACIEMIYTEYPFLERIGQGRRAGLRRGRILELGQQGHAGDQSRSRRSRHPHRDLPVQPGRDAHPSGPAGQSSSPGSRKASQKPRRWASRSPLPADRRAGRGPLRAVPVPGALAPRQKYQSVLDGLKALAPLAEKAGVTLVLEPLNTQVDHPGYFLNHSEPGSSWSARWAARASACCSTSTTCR